MAFSTTANSRRTSPNVCRCAPHQHSAESMRKGYLHDRSGRHRQTASRRHRHSTLALVFSDWDAVAGKCRSFCLAFSTTANCQRTRPNVCTCALHQYSAESMRKGYLHDRCGRHRQTASRRHRHSTPALVFSDWDAAAGKSRSFCLCSDAIRDCFGDTPER